MSPQLNQPFALARAGDFVAVATPMAFVVSALTLAAGLALVVIFRFSRLGRELRAYADDPLAAELMGDRVRPQSPRARLRYLGFGWPGRRNHDRSLRRGRLQPLGDPHLEGADRGDHRRHRVSARRFPGRQGSIVGAVETGWSALFPIDDRDIAVYVLLTIFIALRPSGLLGQREAVDATTCIPTPVLT